MSAEPQPRRRKDKRRKKDASSSERSKAEAEFIARKLSVADDSDEGPPPPKSHHSQPSSSQAFTEGDSVIHVDHDHGTGGHWCAKIVFFILLGILVGLIGLIIIEHRGLTDLDTPVAESRFAQVFDGWVDEGPIHDDHHDEHTLELKHDDDEHDDEHEAELSDNHEEEIEDIESEVNDSNSDDEHLENDSEAEEHDQISAEDEEQADNDDNDEENAVDQDDDNDDNDEDEEQHDDNDDDDEDEVEEDQISNEDDDSEENMANSSHEMENDDEEESLHGEDISNEFNDNDDSLENDRDISKEDDFENFNKDTPFEEVDSVEEDVVDNTAGEEELLAAKRAEQLAQEQEDNGSMGLRVGVGLALITVTYCVLARKWRNAFGSADDAAELELNRRMTLIPDQIPEGSNDDAGDGEEPAEEEEEAIIPTKKDIPVQAAPQQTSIFGKRPQQIVHKYEEDSEEEIIKPVVIKPVNIEPPPPPQKKIEEIEVSDEEELEEEEEVEEEYEEEEEEIEEPIPVKKVQEIKSEPVVAAKKPVEEIEIEEEYEDEEIEEELDEEEEVVEEEEIEEDISEELDDTELMKKLEEKYGKLPDVDDEAEGQSDDEKPVVPARRRGKPAGGNSVDDDWEDWKRQLDLAQAEMDEGKVEDAYRHFTALSLTNPSCWRAKLGRAKTLDVLAEKKKNNNILQSAIDTYRDVLNATTDDQVFLNVADRLIDRMRFRGKHIDAVPVHKMIINKFPSIPKYRNQLAITYLMVNKIELSRSVLKEILKKWPNDGVALVHNGFILKTVDNNLEEAITYLQKGIDTADEGTKDGRFFFHLGDALARLGRKDEAQKVYELGADLKVFLSPLQRSLYNVDRLTGHPWWKPEQTPYRKIVKELEANWEKIAEEARQLRTEYRSEQESLRDTGDWSQYELFVRGTEVKNHCSKCPVTCRIARSEPAASGCRRGQIKFSAMTPGTHVFAHTGPTNCRLRAHLGLQGTKDTFIRVGHEIRSWQEGKVFIFDDSFEHEVWHNGTSLRIVLIVDLWHPELTNDERASLPAI